MSDIARRLRQLRSAMRVRLLAHEQAEQGLARATQQLRQAEQALDVEQSRYRMLLSQHQQVAGKGVSLDPAMMEQRLLALMSARSELDTRLRQAGEVRQAEQQARSALAQARLALEAVAKVSGRVRAMAEHRLRAHEQVEIFEAACRQGTGT